MTTATVRVIAVAEIDVTAANVGDAVGQIYNAIPPNTNVDLAMPSGHVSVAFTVAVDRVTKIDGIPAGIIT